MAKAPRKKTTKATNPRTKKGRDPDRIMQVYTSLEPVLSALTDLKVAIRDLNFASDETELARQTRALNLIGAAEQYLLDACSEEGPPPGYFGFKFVVA